MLLEVVLFDYNVFCSRSKLQAFSHFDAAAVVLEYFAMELWLGVVERENISYLNNKIHKMYDLPRGLRQCYVLSFSCAERNLGL